jgi:two-component system, cell cycle sensor histidine kinase and response regulator CckA
MNKKKSLEESNRDLKRRIADNTEDRIRRDVDLSRALEAGKRLQEQLRQSQKLECIGTLAAGLVHDFNNILHVVQGHALALVEHEIAPENVVKAGQAIVRAVEQGTVLAHQLLATAGKSEAKLEPADVNSLLGPFIDFMAAAFPTKFTIVSDLGAEMPNIMVDANQINQALLNLCINAKDAMADGGELTVRTRTIAGAEIRDRFHDAESERYVCISVADTGSGMTEETRSHIFEPFFTTKATGTGLGLPVTSAIVQSQNGFIDVVSEPGRGSTFNIYLPIPKQPEALVEATEALAAKEAMIPAKHGETLLFVEDEPQQLKLMQNFLTAQGFNVLTAGDGVKAVEVHRRFKDEIAVVILDLGLAKLNGWEAFRIMKKRNPKVKGILASGFLSPQVRSQLAKGALSALVAKPYLPRDLLAKIEDAIRTA